MTGKDLIIHILQNNLEDAEVFEDRSINPDMLGLVDVKKYAVGNDVGVHFVEALCELGDLEAITINGVLYIVKRSKGV